MQQCFDDSGGPVNQGPRMDAPVTAPSNMPGGLSPELIAIRPADHGEARGVSRLVSDGPTSPPSWRPPLALEVFSFSAGHRRWFFGILIGRVVIVQAVTASLHLLKGGKDLVPLLSIAGYNAGFIAALGLLIYSDREGVHAAVAVATRSARLRPLGRRRSDRLGGCCPRGGCCHQGMPPRKRPFQQRVRLGYPSAGRSPERRRFSRSRFVLECECSRPDDGDRPSLPLRLLHLETTDGIFDVSASLMLLYDTPNQVVVTVGPRLVDRQVDSATLSGGRWQGWVASAGRRHRARLDRL